MGGVVGMFGRKASSWAGKYGAGRPLEKRRQVLVGAVRDLAGVGGRVLDVGCGSAEIARGCSDEGLGVVGCDVSREMLAAARRRHGGLVRLVWIAPDWKVLPFRCDSFDVVLLSSVLEYAQDPLRMLTEVCRVCRPDGHVVATVPDGEFVWRRVESLCRVITRPLRSLVMGRAPRGKVGRWLEYLAMTGNAVSAGEWVREFERVGFEGVSSDSQDLRSLTIIRGRRPRRIEERLPLPMLQQGRDLP